MVQVQDLFNLTQPNAKAALKDAGFESVARRWVRGQINPTRAWVHKSSIPTGSNEWPTLYTVGQDRKVMMLKEGKIEATFIRVEDDD
jgi:hypothetical protein